MPVPGRHISFLDFATFILFHITVNLRMRLFFTNFQFFFFFKDLNFLSKILEQEKKGEEKSKNTYKLQDFRLQLQQEQLWLLLKVILSHPHSQQEDKQSPPNQPKSKHNSIQIKPKKKKKKKRKMMSDLSHSWLSLSLPFHLLSTILKLHSLLFLKSKVQIPFFLVSGVFLFFNFAVSHLSLSNYSFLYVLFILQEF